MVLVALVIGFYLRARAQLRTELGAAYTEMVAASIAGDWDRLEDLKKPRNGRSHSFGAILSRFRQPTEAGQALAEDYSIRWFPGNQTALLFPLDEVIGWQFERMGGRWLYTGEQQIFVD